MNRDLQIVLKLQDQASKELQKVIGGLDDTQKSSSLLGSSLDYVTRAAKAAALGLGATALAAASYGVSIASQLQTTEVGLKTLLGSSEAAHAAMQRIKREAARTPFEIPGLSQNVMLMASVTHDGDKAIDTILNVGEALAALGKGQPEMDRVIINLQQIAAIGHAATVDIKQFAYAGIPIYDMLQKETGLTGEALDEFIGRDHGVTFEMLSRMFDKANDAGGQFFHAFQNQSGTFAQALSNMRDAIGIFLSDMVTMSGLFGLLTEALRDGGNWLLNYKQNLAAVGATIAEFADHLDAQTGIVTAFRDAWDQVAMTWNTNMLPALTQLWTALQPFMPLLEALGRVIGTALVAAIIVAVKELASFVTAAAQLLSILMQMSSWIIEKVSPYVRQLGEDIQYVVNKVNALIDSIGRLSGKGINFAGLAGVAKSAIGATGLPLIPFASGGIVTGPTPALVGEAGPEAIIPLSQMGRMGGITINVYGDVTGSELVERVKEELMSALSGNARFAI